MKKLFIVLAIAFLASCSTGLTSSKIEKVKLRVLLYPWIPDAVDDDFKSMSNYIERDFEKKNPNIDLVIDMSISHDVYDSDNLKTWLNDSDTSYHMVEVDALLLGSLIKPQLLKEWKNINTKKLFSAGKEAGTYDGKIYGIPHWLCGFFVISRDTQISNSKNLNELLAALNNPSTKPRNLAVNFTGNWQVPSLYFDGYFDTYGHIKIDSSNFLVTDKSIIQNIIAFTSECKGSNGNPCTNGGYEYPNHKRPAILFAGDSIDALVGYSEELFNIFSNNPLSRDEIKINSLTLGNGDRPTMFSDIFVQNKNCTDQETLALEKFVAYMLETSTYEKIMLSKFSDKKLPKLYVIPANKDVIVKTFSKDLLYQSIMDEVERAKPFPNEGFVKYRKILHDSINNQIK